MYSRVADRFTPPNICEVISHNLALLHSLVEFHLLLQEEQTLIVHGLPDAGAIRTRLFTKTDSIFLPEVTI
jgi:hypothetical protein